MKTAFREIPSIQKTTKVRKRFFKEGDRLKFVTKFALTEAQAKHLQELADKEDTFPSQIIRNMINDSMKNQSILTPITPYISCLT